MCFYYALEEKSDSVKSIVLASSAQDPSFPRTCADLTGHMQTQGCFPEKNSWPNSAQPELDLKAKILLWFFIPFWMLLKQHCVKKGNGQHTGGSVITLIPFHHHHHSGHQPWHCSRRPSQQSPQNIAFLTSASFLIPLLLPAIGCCLVLGQNLLPIKHSSLLCPVFFLMFLYPLFFSSGLSFPFDLFTYTVESKPTMADKEGSLPPIPAWVFSGGEEYRAVLWNNCCIQ